MTKKNSIIIDIDNCYCVFTHLSNNFVLSPENISLPQNSVKRFATQAPIKFCLLIFCP